MNKFIYMDNHATTQVDPRVVEVMLPYFTENFGNPASKQHRFGWIAEEAVEASRNSITSLMNLNSKELIFTSGATESNNLAIKGVCETYSSKGKHIITCSTEHKSVLDSCKNLEKKGFQITYLPVDECGIIDINKFNDAIHDNTILVTIMIANNEIGTIQNLSDIGLICNNKGIVFHTDATQAIGKIPINIESIHTDLISFSAHKMYGPKGIGGLIVRNRNPKIRLVPQIDGGGHEAGIRSGTINVPAVVGFAKAFEICYGQFFF